MDKYSQFSYDNQTEGIGHERLRDLLPIYAMARLQDRHPTADDLLLEAHLAECHACREELDTLVHLLAATAAGDLPDDPTIPDPDHTCLPPWSGCLTSVQPAEDPLPIRWSAEAPRHWLITFTSALLPAMHGSQFAGGFRTERMERSADRPEQTHAAPDQSADLPAEYHHEIRGTPPDDFIVAIDLMLTSPVQQVYQVRIMLVTPGDPFDQAGHRVTLSYEATSLEAVTDARGYVRFPDIPYAALPHLRLTVHLRDDP